MEFNLSDIRSVKRFERFFFIRLSESDPRYMSYFMEADSKGNKKNIEPPSFDD